MIENDYSFPTADKAVRFSLFRNKQLDMSGSPVSINPFMPKF